MDRGIKTAIKALAVVILLIFLAEILAGVVERKEGIKKNRPFYEETEDIDVLMFGNSHMMNGVFPMELWNDYGIVSYNFGEGTYTLAMSYWTLVNALDYTTPKLVVIDLYNLSADYKITEDRYAHLHKAFDAIPISMNKVRGIQDLIENREDRLEFLWDFALYHNRWKEIGEDDFLWVNTRQKGAVRLYEIAEPEVYEKISSEKILKKETVSMQYLEKMIQFCQEKGIQVLLTYLPFPAESKRQMESNTGSRIAEKIGTDYINFLELEGIIDPETDCADKNSHLNVSGAKKVTNYLGKYITEHYEIPDHREDEEYIGWHRAHDVYMEYKIDRLRKETDLKKFLLLLQDKNFNSHIYMNESDELTENGTVMNLMKNADATDITRTEAHDMVITVTDALSGELIDEAVFEGNSRINMQKEDSEEE